MMIILFAIIHAFAYLPTALFGGFSGFLSACRGRVSHAYSNWRDYHYCAALMVAIITIYPIIAFFSLIVDGFNPYDELTTYEMRIEGGMQADIVYLLRVILHTFILIATIYIFVMLIVIVTIRHVQKYPGQYTGVALSMSKRPYGALFFEEGEYFDCGICLAGIWKGSDVVRLGCDEKHVFHEKCLRDQISGFGNKYCVICHAPV